MPRCKFILDQIRHLNIYCVALRHILVSLRHSGHTHFTVHTHTHTLVYTAAKTYETPDSFKSQEMPYESLPKDTSYLSKDLSKTHKRYFSKENDDTVPWKSIVYESAQDLSKDKAYLLEDSHKAS